MGKLHNVLLKAAMAVASTRLGGVLATTVLAPVDRWLLQRSNGRNSIAGLGVPTLLLTTIGRQSGEPRSTPLLYLEKEHRFFVVASRGGRPGHANWYLNLLQHPHAQITVHGREHDCMATELCGKYREDIWQAFMRLNPYFARYEARLERHIPVIELLPSQDRSR